MRFSNSALARSLAFGLMVLAAPAGAQQQQGQPVTPDPAFTEMVIKNTLIALNQANLTGNYSVLRELATPAFQAQNSTGRLSDAFARLRQQRLDMSGIVLVKPQLTQPAVVQNNQLRLTGYFPTSPLRIEFDSLFILVNGRFRLHGLNVVPAGQQGKGPEATSKSDSQKQSAD